MTAHSHTTEPHIVYQVLRPFLLPSLHSLKLPNFYFAIFARSLPSSKDRFGTPTQSRISGDGTVGKRNAPACLNHTHQIYQGEISD